MDLTTFQKKKLIMETRSKAKFNEQEDDSYRQEEINDDGFEQRITETLVEIKAFITKTETRQDELQQQVDDLITIVESQKLYIERRNCGQTQKIT